VVAFVVVTAIPVINTWRAERKKRKEKNLPENAA
jgi:hypothetical protein